MDVVRRKRREKWRTKSWLLLQDNAPAHRSVLVDHFLAKKYVTTLQHHPYSIYLTPADFYPFPRLKSAVKAQRFCGASDFINNATEEPKKRLSQNGFQEFFQHLYSLWQNCMVE